MFKGHDPNIRVRRTTFLSEPEIIEVNNEINRYVINWVLEYQRRNQAPPIVIGNTVLVAKGLSRRNVPSHESLYHSKIYTVVDLLENVATTSRSNRNGEEKNVSLSSLKLYRQASLFLHFFLFLLVFTLKVVKLAVRLLFIIFQKSLLKYLKRFI